ncbi:MAG: hypothetical protein IJK42_11375 [Prevotella sp.]|nr:hypothetical protein [Prevotella sp.]
MKANNDETMFLDGLQEERKEDNVKNDLRSMWKPVTIGGTSAMMLGIGALAANQLADGVLQMGDEKSFEEALDEARAELGSDGVFQYKDGVYTTCSPEEWVEMSDEQIADLMTNAVSNDLMEIDLSSAVHPMDDSSSPIVVEVNDNYGPIAMETGGQAVQVVPEEIDPSDVVLIDDDAVAAEEVSVVDRIIDEIVDLISPDSVPVGDVDVSTLQASKDVEEVEVEDVDDSIEVIDDMANPEVAPDMPDYMEDADISSII